MKMSWLVPDDRQFPTLFKTVFQFWKLPTCHIKCPEGQTVEEDCANNSADYNTVAVAISP